MKKIIIAAVAENGVIGKDGDIPWHYSEDLKHFKQKTTGHSVIMGRKTYFSLPEDFRPLPDRKNIVLSRSNPELPESVNLANSLEEAWEIAENHSGKAFIIGGAGVYEQAMNESDKMILTRIHQEYEGDTYFPEWDKENWKEIERDDREELSFVEYRKTV
ncbi:MAG: dihydrofolate reductase [Candidatus Nanohaloarchaea archaeon]|jgi:dihydrofolate reductase